MQKDWFPFFSMLFWCGSKLFGLGLAITGLWGTAAAFTAHEFSFWALLLGGLVPVGLGGVLLVTEIVFDAATAEMKNRQSLAK
jgi:hypothetical protein